MCQQVLDASILGRAAQRGYIETHCHQIRDYTLNRQKQTDDYPYGGGCGMVLYAQPIADCLRHVQAEVAAQGRPAPHIVFLTAGGARYTEEHARRLAAYDNLTLVCGHYEGIDERVIDAFADEEISIGDYILTGGELASLVVADSVLRLQPGVLAEQKGYEEESYWDGLLEYPQYTRPEVWEGRAVPAVLLGGDHEKIAAWRGQQSRLRTRLRRPELYDQWCDTHPLTQLPKWKRGETMRLVRTEEQLAAAAQLLQRAGEPSAPRSVTRRRWNSCQRRCSWRSFRKKKSRDGPAISTAPKTRWTAWSVWTTVPAVLSISLSPRRPVARVWAARCWILPAKSCRN